MHVIYAVTSRNDAIQMVTTVIGLIVGLVTVLKFIVSRAVRLMTKCAGCRRCPAVGHRSHAFTATPIRNDQMNVENACEELYSVVLRQCASVLMIIARILASE